MKSNLEQTLSDKKARAELVIGVEFGDDALDALYNFSDLDCIIDVKLEAGWERWVFLEGDEKADDAIRRIG